MKGRRFVLEDGLTERDGTQWTKLHDTKLNIYYNAMVDDDNDCVAHDEKDVQMFVAYFAGKLN